MCVSASFSSDSITSKCWWRRPGLSSDHLLLPIVYTGLQVKQGAYIHLLYTKRREPIEREKKEPKSKDGPIFSFPEKRCAAEETSLHYHLTLSPVCVSFHSTRKASKLLIDI